MPFIEKSISEALVYQGPVFDVVKHKVETVSGEGYRDVVSHNGGAVILAITDDKHIILVRQFRKPIEEVILELPAGKIDPGETPADTAARELKEETGYKAASIQLLQKFWPSPGYSNEVLYIYLAQYLESGDPEPDDTEDIELVFMEPCELLDLINDNKILDSKTIIGVTLAHMKGLI